MTQRIECTRFPRWDGAEVIRPASFTFNPGVYVRSARPASIRAPFPDTDAEGAIMLTEIRGVVGVAEDEGATLYGWSPVLRRWVTHSSGTVADLRLSLAELRRAFPRIAFWIKPSERP
jgi:hypothetical protein